MSHNIELSDDNLQAMEELMKTIRIPPRPSLLQDLQDELSRSEPDLKSIAEIASRDAAITAGVLRTVNSALYGLPRQVETVESAVSYMGVGPVASLITWLVAQRVLSKDRPVEPRFWDMSAKRSVALTALARRFGSVDRSTAQLFGLFCDIGEPLMFQRFENYGETLALASEAEDEAFTSVERARHLTDHATVGAMMTRSWGLSQVVSGAIRYHHDYSILSDVGIDTSSRELVAMGLIAGLAIARFDGKGTCVEWEKGKEGALALLELSDDAVLDLCDDLHDLLMNER